MYMEAALFFWSWVSFGLSINASIGKKYMKSPRLVATSMPNFTCIESAAKDRMKQLVDFLVHRTV